MRLTYSMEHSPSWETNWFSASQEIPRILWNPKVHHRNHKCPLFLWLFRYVIRFYGEELLAPRPTPKMEDHPLSDVRDCLFNIYAATLRICRPFLHPQSEEAPCCGDRDPLIVDIMRIRYRYKQANIHLQSALQPLWVMTYSTIVEYSQQEDFYRVPLPAARQTPQSGGPVIRTFQLPPPGVPHIWNVESEPQQRNVELWARNFREFCRKWRLPRYFWVTCCKFTTWDRRLYFPSEGRRAEDFFRQKNPTPLNRLILSKAAFLKLFSSGDHFH